MSGRDRYLLHGDPQFPGHGYPPRPGERGAMAPGWPRLSHGQATGKKGVLFYDAEDENRQRSLVSLLAIEGDDADACQMVVTLAPPTVVPIVLTNALRNQNLTGEQGNLQLRTRGNFPGEATPLAWAPLEAILEWGTGGTSVKAAVDYVNGLTINVTASFLRVSAAVASSERSGLTGMSAAYVIAAFASPGFVQAGVAQRTIYVGSPAEGIESEVFSIPRFAKRAYLIGCDPAAAPGITIGTIRWWQSADGVAGANNLGNMFVSGNQPQAFDVPNGAQYFSVLPGMAGSVLFSVVFDLAI